MAILNENESILLIIDVQDKLLNAVFNKKQLENQINIISSAVNILEIPTLITEQYPKGLGSTIESIKLRICANAIFKEKTTFSAMDNPSIVETLRLTRRKQVIICGIETHICVSQTANALIDMGYDVSVVSDACGSRSEYEHYSGLNRMKENGAHIITTEIMLFEWLKSSSHPKFKEVQNLIK